MNLFTYITVIEENGDNPEETRVWDTYSQTEFTEIISPGIVEHYLAEEESRVQNWMKFSKAKIEVAYGLMENGMVQAYDEYDKYLYVL